MGTEAEDLVEYIFVAELVLQQPPNGSLISFQRDIDGDGNVISTQTASIEATATKNWNIVLDSGSYTLTGTDVTLTYP